MDSVKSGKSGEALPREALQGHMIFGDPYIDVGLFTEFGMGFIWATVVLLATRML